MNDHDAVRARFEHAGQGQVFRFWPKLDNTQRAALIEQAREIDLAEIARLNATLVRGKSAGHVDLSGLEPAPCIALPSSGGDRTAWIEAKLTGEDALRRGKVAAFTVAGGQGTRLGYDGPKGTFAVTPVRGHSLFHVFAEKLLAAQRRYGCELLWMVMTSHANHAATEEFFARHRHFGLRGGQVIFFRQGRMPAVDFDGRILLEAPGTIALSPDGHGGSLRALVRSGAIERLERAGVEVLSFHQVDNPLVCTIDPAFIGFHLQTGSEMSSRMVPKAYDKEKVGHFCRQHGKVVVIEYSDMPDTLTSLRDGPGELVYRAGSVAIHLLSTAFVRRVGEGATGVVLPFHRADKKIPTIDDAGAPAKPAKPNGVKFEMFVFDALPFARGPIVVEAARGDAFSPVKNAEGVDSPQTCRDDQMRQWVRWMHAAGVPVAVDATGKPALRLEISPLFATDEDSFAESWARLDPKPALQDGLVLA
jgi:UDP-N-acetylglucosamine/UDP-N-acetylgalactosamine diphosphorylase